MTRHATVGDAIAAAARRLAAAGVPEPRREARLLAAHVLGLSPESVFARPERPVTGAERARLDGLAARRADREPLAYVVGTREFWSLPLQVTPATLTPRPETETAVEAALAALPPSRPTARVLDLGTGSGCLLLAILHERPRAVGIGIDRSEAAVRVARANALANGLADRSAFVVGDWLSALAGRFELIVANPPYVAEAAFADLEPEVARHEPRLALAGGPDGLDAYRAILPQVSAFLTRTGAAVFEVGAGQAAAVLRIARAAGLQAIETRRDLAGTVRCVTVAARAGMPQKKSLETNRLRTSFAWNQGTDRRTAIGPFKQQPTKIPYRRLQIDRFDLKACVCGAGDF